MKVLLLKALNEQFFWSFLLFGSQNQRVLIENKSPASPPIKSTTNSQSDAGLPVHLKDKPQKNPVFIESFSFVPNSADLADKFKRSLCNNNNRRGPNHHLYSVKKQENSGVGCP